MSNRGSRRGEQFRSRNNRGRFSPATHRDRNSNNRIYSVRDHNSDAIDDNDDETSQQNNLPPNICHSPLAIVEQFPTPTEASIIYRPSNAERRFSSPRSFGAIPQPLMNMSRLPTHQTFRNSSFVQPTSISVVIDSKEKVEKCLAEIVAHYCSKGEYVSVENVIQQFFTTYKVTQWTDLKINNVENPCEDLKPLYNLIKRHNKLNLLLDVFKQIRVIRTLDELDEEILNHFKIESYDELKLGPIFKHPKIETLFDLRNTSITRQTKSSEIIELFHKYTRTVKYNEKVDFEAFQDHAAKHFGVEKWNNLGVYITSFPYVLQVNKIFSFLSYCYRGHSQ
ncbi:unnamed protein product [Rotaria sordida]|uniref:Uncharacterized protein n=1 Tax=Rotaria sordida TaxID=392033 RepID=A0A814ATD5_9BILA|nr:unnamed protein product [Rotaria sordida]